MSWLADLLRNFYSNMAPTLYPDYGYEDRKNAQAEYTLRGPFRYLIAVEDRVLGKEGEIFELGYHGPKPMRGRFFRYGNLLAQENFDRYGPYLRSSDTAAQYDERVVDPTGGGWPRLLKDQCDEAIAAGAEGIEWDNPDSYPLMAVQAAVDYARSRGLKVIGKNPLICDWNAKPYISHPAVCAVVVERGCGNPKDMDDLRKACGKSDLLVVFVAFGAAGASWAHATALQASHYTNMWVTHSPHGEYTTAEDVV